MFRSVVTALIKRLLAGACHVEPVIAEIRASSLIYCGELGEYGLAGEISSVMIQRKDRASRSSDYERVFDP